MSMASARLLKLALPLVRTHGFTRETLSRSVLALPATEAHTEPLSDTAVSALFGRGDDARRILIEAWLGDGLRHMSSIHGVARPVMPFQAGTEKKATVRDALRARLEYNEQALPYLPEAFALLVSPSSSIHLFDPLPALKHAARIAEKACYTTGDKSLQLEWYARRISLAAVYTAAELHQLTSPHTAYSFLDSLLDSSSSIKSSLDETVSLMSAPHPPKTKPAPNFFSTCSVILPVTLQTAYRTFGTAAGHDRVCHLSKLCTKLELLEQDEVTLPVPDYPEGKRLGEVGVRTSSAKTTSDPSSNNGSIPGSLKTLTRQHFVLEETVPLVFGLFKKKVKIVGTLTWDDSVLSPPTGTTPGPGAASSAENDSPVESLYESLAVSSGILVWKLRTFDTVDGDPDKTRVTERIEGWAPALLRPIVQNVTTVEHHAHMGLYHTLL